LTLIQGPPPPPPAPGYVIPNGPQLRVAPFKRPRRTRAGTLRRCPPLGGGGDFPPLLLLHSLCDVTPLWRIFPSVVDRTLWWWDVIHTPSGSTKIVERGEMGWKLCGSNGLLKMRYRGHTVPVKYCKNDGLGFMHFVSCHQSSWQVIQNIFVLHIFEKNVFKL